MARTYGIDIHGTLACRRPNKTVGPSTLFPLLAPLMRAWVKKGETVYILSGPPIEVIQAEVLSLGLIKGEHYHSALSVVDFLKEHGTPMWEDPVGSNHWWADKTDWNATKGRMAVEYGIDVIIDDEPDYSGAMPESTEFVLVSTSLLGC